MTLVTHLFLCLVRKQCYHFTQWQTSIIITSSAWKVKSPFWTEKVLNTWREHSTYRHPTGSWGQRTCLFFCFAFALHPWFSVQPPRGQKRVRHDFRYLILCKTCNNYPHQRRNIPCWRWTPLLIFVEFIIVISSKKPALKTISNYAKSQGNNIYLKNKAVMDAARLNKKLRKSCSCTTLPSEPGMPVPLI